MSDNLSMNDSLTQPLKVFFMLNLINRTKDQFQQESIDCEYKRQW